MSDERQLREGLRFALSGEPMPVFDPDVIIAMGRKEIRRRRLLISATVATVLVVGGVVAVPAALSHRGVPPAKAPSAAPLPPSVRQELGFAWPPADAPRKVYSAEQLRARGGEMQAHLRSRLGQVVLAATGIVPGAFGARSGSAVTETGGYLENLTTFTVNGAPTGISLRIFAPASGAPRPTELCSAGQVLQCDVVHLADGSSLVLETVAGKNLTGAVVATVTHYRTSGTVVSASAYNYDPATTGRILYQPAVPVTNQQLATLVTDPALGL
jgi:hypothetical protein